WLFSYATGNPIAYSALKLRESLEQALAALGGTAADPALGHMVLIGHSQGGLLVKMQVIDPKDALWNRFSSRPLNELRLSDTSRAELRRALFPTPMPEVDRVIFISTPHHGAFVAGYSIVHWVSRLITFPLSLTQLAGQNLTGNADVMHFNMSGIGAA